MTTRLLSLATILFLPLWLSCASAQDPRPVEPSKRPTEGYPPILKPALPGAQNDPAGPGPPFLQPYVSKPAPGATAEWRRGIGLPDKQDDAGFGLLLETGDGGGEVGVEVYGVQGLSSLGKEISFDYRNDGACTKEFPAIIITRSDGERSVFGCAEGKPSPAPSAPNDWTHVQFALNGLPPGVTVKDLNIFYNITGKSVVIDNFRLITWVIGWPGLSVYVADTLNHRIVRIDNWIDSGWIAKWITFGSLGSGVNQFNTPEGVTLDAQGRIYVADTGNHRVVRIDNMFGTGFTVLGGTCGPGVNQFCFPSSVFVDGTGHIYVTEPSSNPIHSRSVQRNNRVVRVDDMLGAGWVTNGGGGGTTVDGLNAVFLDGASRIYVADYNNSRVTRMNDMSGAGWITTPAGVSSCLFRFGNAFVGHIGQTRSVFVDSSGHVFVSDRFLWRLNDISGGGCLGFAAACPAVRTGPCYSGSIWGIGGDTTGRIYLSENGPAVFPDSLLSRMKDMAGAGRVTLGTRGSGVREFNDPKGIYVDGREPEPAWFRGGG